MRYGIVLSDVTPAGAVNLNDPPLRRETVRVQPLPAFRVAREARRLYRQFRRARADHAELTEDDLIMEEQALAAFSALEFRLSMWSSGVFVPNAIVRLLPGEPPLVQVQFLGPEDAPAD